MAKQLQMNVLRGAIGHDPAHMEKALGGARNRIQKGFFFVAAVGQS